MKKLSAIILIFILFFNVYGYRILINILNNKADTRLENRLDNSNYDESRLIEIRVALNMPYQERFTDFERHYGKIEMDGIAYTYVKKKIAGDVVIFKCIANETGQQLKEIKNHITLANTSADNDKTGQQTFSFAKIFFGEYVGLNAFQLPAFLKDPAKVWPEPASQLFILNKKVPTPPPQDVVS